jgi:hypothetical protein
MAPETWRFQAPTLAQASSLETSLEHLSSRKGAELRGLLRPAYTNPDAAQKIEESGAPRSLWRTSL